MTEEEIMRDYDKPQSFFTPVDPDLSTAREICALRCELNNLYGLAKRYRDGDFDLGMELDTTLSTVKRLQKLYGDKS